ncbi:glycoside hydrolase family 2 TIM barrel-domain containing protein [Chitinophaga sancti]|uniref:glycoside hydrolase family 2 protein n=1 Tax=Chitinophaga sancti TaxID=1004 RepID=UPI002A75A4ED|nr:glycoside hydrolase family 2 TIM barrel-domain containing protein [Chitinophaga sancti]WPQ61721.1 glycoside hydrolase family 2 TIM barrel-domain containing protein [Chitinophaga sancti]
MKSIALLLLFHVTGTILYGQQLTWKISPQADTKAHPADIATAGFNDNDWVPGIVPGTVFYAYVKAGKESDPDYAENIYKVDKAKYNRPFWYRTEFAAPRLKNNQRLWLKFNGINKYATIYLNGKLLGSLHGHMQRGIYDVTDLLKSRNAIGVLIAPPKWDPDHDHPLANWESPTYICSGSWDWMPAVPGLNSGITDTVALTVSGPVTISDPWVRTVMPDTNSATLHIAAQLTNSSPVAISGKLKAVITPGNITISSTPVTLAPGTHQEISLPQQLLQHPHLWWPNGYGDQFLYSCKLSFETATTVTQNFGVRKVTSDTTALNGPMRLYINDVPILVKGGNWGMSDYMLKVRDKDYEPRIRMHQDMHFNMIRNWTGEVTDNAFYEYCDKYGIMVWDDFWLNNIGGIDSLQMFSDNVVEKLKKLRNHPSIVIWCGANEGTPGSDAHGDISNAITTAIKQYDADDKLYLPRSNASVDNPNFSIHGSSKVLSGSGIWANVDPKVYFTDPHNGYLFSNNSWGMRSELGTATFVNVESFKKFMPKDCWVVPTPEAVNSKDNMWARHFFCTDFGLGGGADPVKYINDINRRYGPSQSLEEFCKKAQLLNLETMKAMFEGWNDHMWKDASGMLIWMSQSAYPTMIWQTYDYYYDLTGAYFGAKSACEPIHVQWNPASKMVKVINNKNYPLQEVTVEASIYNTDGKQIATKKATLKVAPTNISDVFTTMEDTTGLSFLRLKLYDHGKLLSANEYMIGDYTLLNKLPPASVVITKKVNHTYIVKNNSTHTPAVGIRLQLKDSKGNQILPAIISDSYFSLMQGEEKEIKTDVDGQLVATSYN